MSAIESRKSADTIKLMSSICKLVDKMKPNPLIRSICVELDFSKAKRADDLEQALWSDRDIRFTIFVNEESKERGFTNTFISIYSWDGEKDVDRKLAAIRNMLVATSWELIDSLSDQVSFSRCSALDGVNRQ